MNRPFHIITTDDAVQESADRISIADDWMAVCLVKALTDRVERTGHGTWMAEPEASTVRAIVYREAGIEGWATRHDAVARRRLRLWEQLFWLPRQEEREVE